MKKPNNFPKNEKYEEAIKLYDQAIKLCPLNEFLTLTKYYIAKSKTQFIYYKNFPVNMALLSERKIRYINSEKKIDSVTVLFSSSESIELAYRHFSKIMDYPAEYQSVLKELFKCCENISITYMDEKRFEKALSLVNMQIDFEEKQGNVEQLLKLYVKNLMRQQELENPNFHNINNSTQKIIDYHRNLSLKNINKYELLNASICFTNLSLFYKENGFYEKAIQACEYAITVCPKECSVALVENYLEKIILLLKLNNVDIQSVKQSLNEAKKHFEKKPGKLEKHRVKICQDLDRNALAESFAFRLVTLANFCLEQGKYEEALEHVDYGISICKQQQHKILKLLYECKANIYLERASSESTLSHVKKFIDFIDFHSLYDTCCEAC